MSNPIQHHVEGLIGAGVALPVSVGLTTGAIPAPDGAPWWASYLATLIVTCTPVVLSFLLKREKREPLKLVEKQDCPEKKEP